MVGPWGWDPAVFRYGVDDPQFGGRANFDSFFQATVVVFQVLTLEDWEFVMFKTVAYAVGPPAHRNPSPYPLTPKP